MRRTGLGRRGRIEEQAGDPLEGLVNLFDIGMILAVAFLIAGLSVGLTHLPRHGQDQPGAGRVLPSVAGAPRSSGRGVPVGQVYRLADGRLVYVRAGQRRP